MLAATLAITACTSPYADALKTSLAACQADANDRQSCQSAHDLGVADAQWRAQENEKAGNVALAILGGLAIGAAAYGAARSAPPPLPPVFVPPPPPPPFFFHP